MFEYQWKQENTVFVFCFYQCGILFNSPLLSRVNIDIASLLECQRKESSVSLKHQTFWMDFEHCKNIPKQVQILLSVICISHNDNKHEVALV